MDSVGDIRPMQQIATCHRESNDVKRNADGLRQVERQANCTTNVKAKRPGNHIISTTSFDLLIRRDFRHRERSWHGHQMPHQHNHQGRDESDVGHSVPKTQEQDGTQNGRYGRQKDRPCPHRFQVGG